jgi:hypothetical protein
MKVKKMQVIRVDKDEFELEDGRVYEHPIPLEEVPTLEEFQKTYEKCYKKLMEMLDE